VFDITNPSAWGVAAHGATLLINEPFHYDGEEVTVDVETDEKDGFVGLALVRDDKNVYYYTDLKLCKVPLEFGQLCGHNLKGDLHWLKRWDVNVDHRSGF